jgi:hypothetical protein
MQIRSIRTFSIRTLLLAVVLAVVVLSTSTASFAQVGVGVFVNFAPPPIPVYEQPICPGDGYIWTPGYWAYDQDFDDYYWVPGTWVMAPEVGFLWTPGYWGWGGSGFVFYDGYWGPVVGFYGGINYGFGYFGEGFAGGRWDHDRFYYNTTVTNVNVTNIHNVYNTTVINNNTTRVSYNGGSGGINARPTPQQEAAAHERHIAPVAAQTRQVQQARKDPQQRASANMGKPPVAATPKPGNFKDHVVRAQAAGGSFTPPANRGGNRGRESTAAPRPENRPQENNVPRPPGNGNVVHPRDLPPASRPSPPSTGNAKQDQKYQQQQEKQFAKQEQERQKLQQQQERDHQRLQQQHADTARQQQVEQRHQQQTQQMQQRHEQQQQKMQRQQPPPRESRPSGKEKEHPPGRS